MTEKPGALPWPEPDGRIEFRAVEFHYVTAKPILRGVSFRIGAGEFVAIAGSSGSGKSTLLNLLLRFYDVSGSSINVDDLDLRE